MEQALVISDSSSSDIYAIATEKDGSIRIFGSSDSAKEWAEWANARVQGRGKLTDLLKFLDVSFTVDGPKPLTRPVRAQIAQSMQKFGEEPQKEILVGRSENEKSAFSTVLAFLPPVANPDIPLSRALSASAKKSLLDYKGLAFRNEQMLMSMGFDIKKANAVFDPNLGPSGGYRCPAATRYGGQITDRYGRNCGRGIARRLANALTETGGRLEGSLDGRRERRVARRDARMTRRLARDLPGVGRRRSGMARAMARGENVTTPQGTPRRERRGLPERAESLADRVDGGWGRRPRAERRAGRVGERTSRPGGRTGRTGLPERMDRASREVLEGTFLEERRKRRRARQGTARNREGIPERMDRSAREVLEGTFLENRRQRRRQSVRQQAQERPRVAAGSRTRRAENATERPSRRVRVEADEPTPKKKPVPEVPETETVKPKKPKPEPGFRNILPNGSSPQRSDIADPDERERRTQDFVAKLRKQRIILREMIEENKNNPEWAEMHGRTLEALRLTLDRAARNSNRSMAERLQSAELRDIAEANIANLEMWRRRQSDPLPVQPPTPEPAVPDAPKPPTTFTYLSRSPGFLVTSDQIRGYDQQRKFEKDNKKAVANAEKRAKKAAKAAGDDQEKLRELAAQAQRSAESAKVRNRGSDERGMGRVPMETRVNAITEGMVAEAEARIYQAALQRVYEVNGEDRPSPERLAEMGKEAKKEVKSTLARRSKKLGDFLRAKYGDDPAPWLAEDRVRQSDLQGMDEDALLDWAKQIYQIDELVSPSGAIFKTVIKLSDSDFTRMQKEGYMTVDGNIFAKDPKTDELVIAGSFSRTISAYDGNVSHVAMDVTANRTPEYMRESVRSSGFATLFNGHAAVWLKGAGFDGATVSAVDDGPFVWPRLGFRTDERSDIDGIHAEIRSQLDNYRSGETSIIANDRDAAKIQFLLDQPRSDGGSSSDVQHTDFILALSNRDDPDQVVRNYFRVLPHDNSSRWGQGVLEFTNQNFPDDPRSVQ